MPETPRQPSEAEVPSDLVARLTAERDQYKRLYLEQLAINRKLELGVVGKGRERDVGDPNQITMSLLGMLTGANGTPPPSAKEPVRAHERAKPTGRQLPPEKLPRIDVEVLPPEVQARGLDAFEKIGEDVTETVERRPAALVVVRVHKPKFVEKNRDLKIDVVVHQAPPPELPIERALCGPGLLADTIVKRWEDHLPLHRLERIYARDGWEIARSTMCDWHLEALGLVRPLIAAMFQDALRAPYVCADATGVLVQNADKCKTAHFFLLASPKHEREGRTVGGHVLFLFSRRHDKVAVDKLLDDYKGYLVADAHSVYEHLFEDGSVKESACWAHARRYFFKSLGSDPLRARHAIALIGKLFAIERALAPASAEARKSKRLELSTPVLDAFESWCDTESCRVLDESPIARAIGYARNQRAALRTFLEDGRLPIHNNWSERELRREALGRKNWLFIGSDDGGDANAAFVSLIASCRLHGIEPAAYLRDLFCLLPSWNVQRVLELAPSEWTVTSARPDVRKLLDENVYRRAVLGSA